MSLHCRQPLSRSIEIDDERDIATIYGTKISGELLRTLGEPTPPGRWFRIIKGTYILDSTKRISGL